MSTSPSATEVESFVGANFSRTTETTAFFDTVYSRSAFGTVNVSNGANFMELPMETADQSTDVMWVGMTVANNNQSHTKLTRQIFFQLGDDFCWMITTKSTFDGSGMYTRDNVDTGDPNYPWTKRKAWPAIITGAPQRITLKVTKSTGQIDMYVNGELYPDGSLTVPVNMLTSFTNVKFSNHWSDLWWSECLMSSDGAILERVSTMYPTADGTDTNFSGNYTDVDAVATDELTYWSTETAGVSSSVIGANLDASLTDASRRFRGVWVAARVLRDQAPAATGIRAYVKIGGVRYYGGTMALADNSGWVPYRYRFELNPATGLAWLKAELSGLEYGFETT